MVYLDQRGSGRSDRPKAADNYSIAQLVDDIEALRVHLGAPRIDLIGHSFGTILGLEYAARYPGRVAHLVLAGAAPDLPRAIDIQCARLQSSDPAAFARAAQSKTPGAYPRCDVFSAYDGDAMSAAIHRNMYPNAAIGRKVDAMDSANSLGNTGELGNALSSKGLWSYHFADAAKVSAPTLVIAGGRDFQAVEAPQRDLAKALPRGRFLLYPNDGHFMDRCVGALSRAGDRQAGHRIRRGVVRRRRHLTRADLGSTGRRRYRRARRGQDRVRRPVP